MLRQLARLTRTIPAAGPDALTVAVYADGDDETIAARESGFEGVACVDDAARLLGVLCQIWERSPSPEVERWARGLLDFVLWMQQPDGRWINFVYDWDGGRNEDGQTSLPGAGTFWHARATAACSHAWLTFGDERAHAAMQAGLEHAVDADAPSDVRAIHVETGLRVIADGSREDLVPIVLGWARQIAECQIDGVLMNNAFERGEPHLWAHIQEGVVAHAGASLGAPDLVTVAARSMSTFIEPIIRSGFDRPSVTPYDVSSALSSVGRLSAATGDEGWGSLASDARAWFDRRDASGTWIYDRERGRVADGVDDARVSLNSGAEANIEAASALPQEAIGSVPLAVTLLPPTSKPA